MSLIQIVAQLNNCLPEDIEEGVATSCNTTLPQITADGSALETGLGLVFGTITGVAVVILVVQGIRFVLSQGDPEKTAQARKGVIYAAAGLVVVFMADIAVAFLLGRFF